MAHGTPKGNVFTGARARFSVNGIVIGYATNCSGSEEITYEPIKVLDHIQTVEFAPIDYNVTFTASFVRLVGPSFSNSLRSLGLFPELGNDDSTFLRNILDLDNGIPMQATIEDSRTPSKMFMLLDQVKIASRNWSIGARGVVAEDVSFVAVRMLDEAET
jgi:hypothetical protein